MKNDYFPGFGGDGGHRMPNIFSRSAKFSDTNMIQYARYLNFVCNKYPDKIATYLTLPANYMKNYKNCFY